MIRATPQNLTDNTKRELVVDSPRNARIVAWSVSRANSRHRPYKLIY